VEREQGTKKLVAVFENSGAEVELLWLGKSGSTKVWKLAPWGRERMKSHPEHVFVVRTPGGAELQRWTMPNSGGVHTFRLGSNGGTKLEL
jgi:hypothetical protein